MSHNLHDNLLTPEQEKEIYDRMAQEATLLQRSVEEKDFAGVRKSLAVLSRYRNTIIKSKSAQELLTALNKIEG